MARRRLRLANSGPYVRRADGSAPVAGDVVTALADGSPVYSPPAAGGTILPLADTFFVDKNTSVPVPDQTGSIIAPFSTITAAINALALLGITGYGSVLVTPGDYTAEGPITIPADFANGFNLAALVPMPWGVSFTAVPNGNVTIDSLVVSAPSVTLTNLNMNGMSLTVGAFVNMAYCQFLADIVCDVGANANINANNCQLTRLLEVGQTFLSQCDIQGSGLVISSPLQIIEARSCKFQAAAIEVEFTVGPGDFYVDSITNFYWKAATETLTNGTKVIIGDLAA
jgi:hypothetical protein